MFWRLGLIHICTSRLLNIVIASIAPKAPSQHKIGSSRLMNGLTDRGTDRPKVSWVGWLFDGSLV